MMPIPNTCKTCKRDVDLPANLYCRSCDEISHLIENVELLSEDDAKFVQRATVRVYEVWEDHSSESIIELGKHGALAEILPQAYREWIFYPDTKTLFLSVRWRIRVKEEINGILDLGHTREYYVTGRCFFIEDEGQGHEIQANNDLGELDWIEFVSVKAGGTDERIISYCKCGRYHSTDRGASEYWAECPISLQNTKGANVGPDYVRCHNCTVEVLAEIVRWSNSGKAYCGSCYTAKTTGKPVGSVGNAWSVRGELDKMKSQVNNLDFRILDLARMVDEMTGKLGERIGEMEERWSEYDESPDPDITEKEIVDKFDSVEARMLSVSARVASASEHIASLAWADARHDERHKECLKKIERMERRIRLSRMGKSTIGLALLSSAFTAIAVIAAWSLDQVRFPAVIEQREEIQEKANSEKSSPVLYKAIEGKGDAKLY